MSDYPYAADAQSPLTKEELGVLRSQYRREVQDGHVTVQSSFNYGWGLIKSSERREIAEGVALLGELYRSQPERRREILYYLSLGYYKMAKYDQAGSLVQQLLAQEPNNLQAKSLKGLIDEAVGREGVVGMALVGGAVAVGGLALGMLLRKR